MRRASGLASLALRSRLSALLAAVGELGFELLHLTAELFDLAERLRGAFIILARPGLGAFAERLLDLVQLVAKLIQASRGRRLG